MISSHQLGYLSNMLTNLGFQSPIGIRWRRREEIKPPWRSHQKNRSFEHLSHPDVGNEAAACLWVINGHQCTMWLKRSKLNKLYVSICYQLTFSGPNSSKPPGSTGSKTRKSFYRNPQEFPNNATEIWKSTAELSPTMSFLNNWWSSNSLLHWPLSWRRLMSQLS